MYSVLAPDGTRLGTVYKIAGEPSARRWWAFAIFKPAGVNEHKAGFSSRGKAVAWLEQQQRENA